MSGEELKEAQQADETLDRVRETLVLAETAKEENVMRRKGCCIGEEEWLEERRKQWSSWCYPGVSGSTRYTPSRTLGPSQDEATVVAKIFLA